MALFNEILVGRYNRFLQRFLGIKGAAPAPQLASEISSQFELDSAMNLENRFPGGWRSYALLAAQAAGGAGNRAAIRIVMPPTTGVVAVIEKWNVSSSGLADTPFLQRGPFGTLGFAGPLTGAIRDARQGAGGSSAQVSVSGAAALVGAGVAQVSYGANGLADFILDEHQELVLMPNDEYTVYSTTLNQALICSIFWRERALEEGELT